MNIKSKRVHHKGRTLRDESICLPYQTEVSHLEEQFR